MMTGILITFGLLWVVIGSILAIGTLTELLADRPARQAWRRERMDRFHADALGDFFCSSAGIIWVFTVVLLGWPYFLWETLGESQREN